MKKIIKGLVVLIGVIILGVILMAVFKLCPPVGPWPTPPWCTISEVSSKFTPEPLSYLPAVDNRQLNNSFMFGVGMMDLWGRLCTTPFTCDDPKEDIVKSFSRLKQIGTNLVMVTDFYQIDRDKNIVNVTGGGARTISTEDMKLLVDQAHTNNMKFMLMTNLFEKDKSRKVLNFANPTKQDLDHLFAEWKTKILTQAQKGQYDYLVINPRDIAYFFEKQADNDYMNNKFVSLIPELRQNYSGQICLWGPPSIINGFANQYDCLVVDDAINNILQGTGNNLGDITNKWQGYLNGITYNKPTFVLILMPSYDGALTDGWIEPVGIHYGGDKYRPDYKVQALVYEGFFRAAANHPQIDGVISYGYWWNDRMYPNTLDIFRNDLSHSIRDKDAESVFYNWAQSAR